MFLRGDQSQPCIEAQQQIREQNGPYLPFDGVLAGPEEVSQLKSLLDLLEKHLEPPGRVHVSQTISARRNTIVL